MLKLPAFRMRQYGFGEGAEETTLYITVMKVKHLMNSDIDRWTRENREGYQRPPSEGRFGMGKGSIVRYLLKELGAFPTSVLLNVRELKGKIRFEVKHKNNGIEFGELIIPDGEPLWIIDGQHRLEALKRATQSKSEFAEYPLPVSILNLKEKFDEMLHFYLVNSRQRRIKTDLVYKHLQLMVDKVILGGKEWLKEVILGPAQEREAMAAYIVDYLETEAQSPFHNRIQYVGERKEPHHIVRDYTLTYYISKILKEKALSGLGYDEFAKLLIDYWSVIRELYPKCFENPREYTLLKTTGIASFTYLFPTIFARCASEGDLTKSRMKEYLLSLKQKVRNPELPLDFQEPIDEKWWSSAHGPAIASATSQKIFNEITKNMAKKIEIVQREKRK